VKKIEAIFRPFKFAEVRAALANIGISNMTITEVKGLGEQEGYHETYRGLKNYVEENANIKIEIVVEDHVVEDCIETICTAARTGKVGDGKIFISAIETVVRIRTGEQDKFAL
jgi:nitrogen regulatory protein P-II 1